MKNKMENKILRLLDIDTYKILRFIPLYVNFNTNRIIGVSMDVTHRVWTIDNKEVPTIGVGQFVKCRIPPNRINLSYNDEVLYILEKVYDSPICEGQYTNEVFSSRNLLGSIWYRFQEVEICFKK